MTDYKSSGVDVELGNDASKVLYESAKLTWENRGGILGEVVEIFPDFSGIRGIHVGGLPEGTYMGFNFDGVGTKIEIAERALKHDTVAHDLFAMVCDDAIIRGAEPVIVGSILDVKSLGGKESTYINLIRQLAVGYMGAAREANVAVLNGEIAELGARVQGYGEFNYNWGAGLIWFARKERMITGRDIRLGDKLVALRENGFRSNGLSLVRKIMENSYGKEWHTKSFNGKNLAELSLYPSRIYTKTIVDMTGGFSKEPKARIHGIAHITGGGIPEKLGRILKPVGLGAQITDPFEPCGLMIHCQSLGNVNDEEAYKTWNMGQGMIIITPEPDEVIKIASNHRIDSKVVGEVFNYSIDGKLSIAIHSKGLEGGHVIFY